MKKVKIISLLAMIILMMTTLSVYAADPQVEMAGEETVKAGESKIIDVNLSSDTDTIGVVSGAITKNENVERVELSAQNQWQLLAYNPDNGSFKLVKAAGANTETIMKINYTVKAGATGNVSVGISNLSLTTIEYETKDLADIRKEVRIDNGEAPVSKVLSNIEITSKPNKTSYKEGEKFDPSGMEITANYSDGTANKVKGYTYSPNGTLKATDTKVTISYTEGGVTKQVEQTISVTKSNGGTTSGGNTSTNSGTTTQKDTTAAKTKIPQTGITNAVLIVTAGVAVVGMVFYIKYRKYKEL